jgi:hypothetical protein
MDVMAAANEMVMITSNYSSSASRLKRFHSRRSQRIEGNRRPHARAPPLPHTTRVKFIVNHTAAAIHAANHSVGVRVLCAGVRVTEARRSPRTQHKHAGGDGGGWLPVVMLLLRALVN